MPDDKPKSENRGRARPIPAHTLEESLRVSQKLKELNAGNPWSPEDLAKALDMGAKANPLYYLTAASRDYGLTEGTSRGDEIRLTALGREVAYASSPAAERRALEQAFRTVEVFAKALDYYKSQPLPEIKYLRNTLEGTFGVAPDFHEDFYRLYKENAAYIASISDVVSSDDPNASNAIVVGSPDKRTDRVAFVAMPFSEKSSSYFAGFFGEVLASLITPAGVAAGFRVETAKKEGSDIIHSTIINQLLDADLAIVDLSEHNPNVLFELGVRMAHDKPIALIRAACTGRIFDVDNMLRVFDYSPNLWKSTLERDIPALTAHIKATWESRVSENTYMKILRKGG